jgi:hypothetical protein
MISQNPLIAAQTLPDILIKPVCFVIGFFAE